ncbi:MAG TPA: hypothetical protein PLS19_10520 [bacterium]|nr:hypothetical protein [bacterium]HPN94988.1 hypothetical protein [bacterium]
MLIRRYIFHATILAITIMFGSAANAHLCMLKNGSYTLTDAAVCDSGAGTTPKQVEFFATDSEIALDVVFQQDGTTKKTLDAYQSKIQFDPAMGNPASCNCHDARSAKTSPPPGDLCDSDSPSSVCGSYPVIWNDISSSLTVGLVDDFITVEGGNYYAKVVQGTLGKSTANTNLLMQSLVFKNIYSSETTAAYTFAFDSFTNLFDGNFCELLTEACGCAMQHKGISTIINISKVPCFTRQPAVSSLTCQGRAGTCASDTDGTPADISMAFTLPTGCVTTLGGSTPYTPCEGIKVKITPAAGGAAVERTASPYTAETTLNDTYVSYNVAGASTSCLDSNPVTTSSVKCRCGDPPVVVMQELKKPFIENGAINVKFNVTDPEGGGITQLKFYYTNDPGSARISNTLTQLNLISSLLPNGDVTATIPGTAVKSGTDIYFAIVAQSSMGLETSFPAEFDPEDAESIYINEDGMISGDDIIKGTHFYFVDGNHPYPSSFPFRAGGDLVLKVFFQLNDTADVSARIYSLDGRLIRHLDSSTVSLSSCSASQPQYCNMCNWQEGCVWDGTTYEGGNRYVANGMYIFNIYAVCKGSNFGGSTLDYTKGIVVMK